MVKVSTEQHLQQAKRVPQNGVDAVAFMAPPQDRSRTLRTPGDQGVQGARLGDPAAAARTSIDAAIGHALEGSARHARQLLPAVGTGVQQRTSGINVSPKSEFSHNPL